MSNQDNINMKDKRLKILAANIKAERNRKNITQSMLAESIGISDKSISLIERNIQTPSVFVVKDIADFLGIDINVLFANM